MPEQCTFFKFVENTTNILECYTLQRRFDRTLSSTVSIWIPGTHGVNDVRAHFREKSECVR